MNSSSLFVTAIPRELVLQEAKLNLLFPYMLNIGSLGCKGAFSVLSRVEPSVKCLTKASEIFNPLLYIKPSITPGQASLPTKRSPILTGSPGCLSGEIQTGKLLTVREAGVTLNHSTVDLM